MIGTQASVGIIANPASGRDIRRLVAHATTVDNQGKVGIIRRALVGLGALGVEQVYAMPDSNQLVSQAADLTRSDNGPQVHLLDMSVTHRPEDSRVAAEGMLALGVGCIIILGGDGTIRMAAQGAGETPLLPISTGTNNVLPENVEGTIAGMAAAVVARRMVDRSATVYRHKRLNVSVNGRYDGPALVDVALLRARFVGARAIWRAEDLRRIAVTRASPTSVGITAIAAMIERIPATSPWGLVVDMGEPAPRHVKAALAPGLIESVGVRKAERLCAEQTVHWEVFEPCALAYDGERETVVAPGDHLEVTLRADGPWIVDTSKVMDALAKRRILEH